MLIRVISWNIEHIYVEPMNDNGYLRKLPLVFKSYCIIDTTRVIMLGLVINTVKLEYPIYLLYLLLLRRFV